MLYSIDIVDACNLMCRTCPRGWGEMKNTPNKMSVKTFRAILQKAVKNGCTAVELFNWTEPFLHPELPTFVKEVRSLGLPCDISSNLSLKNIPHLIETLRSGVSSLSVSVSGFTNDVHQINHKGSNIETVKNHLLTISKNKRALGGSVNNVTVKYITFDYNKDEIPIFEKYAKSLGLNFFSHLGYGNPHSLPDHKPIEGINISKRDILRDVNFISPCPLLFDRAALNYKGEFLLCCGVVDDEIYSVGDFLENDFNEMMLKRYLHPRCRVCAIQAMVHRRQFTDEDLKSITNWFQAYSKILPTQKQKKISDLLTLDSIGKIARYSRNVDSCQQDGQVLRISSNGGDPFFILPKTMLVEEAQKISVHLEIEAPLDTELQVFYRRIDQDFSEAQSVKYPLKAGKNSCLLELECPEGENEFRIDPGRVAGLYMISTLKFSKCPKN